MYRLLEINFLKGHNYSALAHSARAIAEIFKFVLRTHIHINDHLVLTFQLSNVQLIVNCLFWTIIYCK